MHSVLKNKNRITRGFQLLTAEPPLKFGNVSQIHGANDHVEPTVFVQISRCRQVPLIAGRNSERIWSKLVSAGVFEIHDAPLGVSRKIGKVAGYQNVEMTVLGEVSNFCP